MYHVLSLSFLSIDGIPGDRIPLLWVKNNGDFSIQTSADANHEKLFAFTESKKHHISIQQVPEDDNAIITIEVDGEVISSVVNNNPQTHHDVKAYVSTKFSNGPFIAEYGALENLVAYHNCF